MGQMVEFPSNGHTCRGYFAAPESGKGPGVVVIQEWWGLVPHIEDLVNRFASAGFCAVAPDLFHGKTTKSPDEAGKLLMELDADRAEREIAGAGEYLLSRPECSSQTYGVIGFCMGGALAQYAATKQEKIGAAISFYGGFKNVKFDWENLHAPLLLIYGENDQGVPAAGGKEREQALKALGKTVELVIYESAGHAFFNDTRPEAYNPHASHEAWHKTIEWFRTYLK